VLKASQVKFWKSHVEEDSRMGEVLFSRHFMRNSAESESFMLIVCATADITVHLFKLLFLWKIGKSDTCGVAFSSALHMEI
jgi:hypothetical protein